jgi:hypothetical protein
MRPLFAAGLLSWVLVVSACATYADSLARGQRAFEQGEHDRALAILRSLEPNIEHLSVPDRVRYGYLRGMTDYRMGYRAEARHWLAIAVESENQTPGSLSDDRARRLTEALGELNERVYSEGVASLSNAPLAPPANDAAEGASDDDPSEPEAAPAPLR